MLLTFLGGTEPLSKSYALDSAGRLTKTSYPPVRDFTSYQVEVAGLPEFASELEHHAALGHCLLKGNVQRQLVVESRAGSTDPNEPTEWVCLDVDRLPGITSVNTLLDVLELPYDQDYILQYSSGYGIEPDRGLTCHLFLRLPEPVLPGVLKQWLIWKNLTISALAGHIQLTKTNMALSWPLDVTTCQNDKLIYIAPPKVTFPVEPIKRIECFVRGTPFLDLSLDRMPSAHALRVLTDERINALRERSGLDRRRFTTKIDKATGLEVLGKCDAATLTGFKVERGFVYFNLNGGDSWGYWHPEDQPEVIRNFKGEPDYLTADLLPDYWAQVQKERKQHDIAVATERKKAREEIQHGTEGANDPQEPRVLVFRDFQTGLYYNGVWQPSTNKLELAQARSETQVQHFLKERGLPEIDFIPVWMMQFRPGDDTRVDFRAKTINTWVRSTVVPQPGDFPTIKRLIEHCVGTNAVYDHFMNWLACSYQFMRPNLTAWILHGVQGTGKGLLINKVLAPLFGFEHVVIKRMEELEDQFNGYLENALLVVVDEAQISESKKSRMIMANLKNQITEPYLSVRRMRTETKRVVNYTSWIFLSNMPDPVVIDSSDRRFNVGVFQTLKLEITDAEIARLETELSAFAHYLATYPTDTALARSVLATEERTRIIETSKTSSELVAEAIKEGMLDVFWDALPSGATDLLPLSQQLLVNEYTNLVHAAMNGKTRFSRDELRVLFDYLCGDMPKTPTKFTQLMRHRSIHIKPMKIDGRIVRGLEVEWRVDPEWLAARQAELSDVGLKKLTA